MRSRLAFMLVVLSCAAEASAQASNHKLDRMVSRLLPLARSVSSHFDALAARVGRDSGTARADSAVYAFWRKPWVVTRRLDTMNDLELLATLDPNGSAAMQLERRGTSMAPAPTIRDSLVRLLHASGVRMHAPEGTLYFPLSAAYLQQRVGCCVSDAMRAYLSMEQAWQERPAGADGSLMVPLDEVIDRMIRAEQYLATHPGSAALPHVRYERDRHLAWILYGIDNSPAFHFRTRELLPGYRQAMERIASERAAHHSGRQAQAMLDLVKSNGYQRTPMVVDYMRARWSEIRPPQ